MNKPLVNLTAAQMHGVPVTVQASVMGLCIKAAADAKWTDAQVDALLTEMQTAHSYGALLAVITQYFEVT